MGDSISMPEKYETSYLLAREIRNTKVTKFRNPCENHGMDLADQRREHFLEWLDASRFNGKTLAEHVGIPYSTLHSYLKPNGKPGRSLRGDNEAQIAGKLGLTVEDLFGSPSAGNHIRAWREKRFWTLDELAEKIGANADYVRGVEEGEIPLSPKVLDRFGKAFEVNSGRLHHDPNDINFEAAEVFQGVPKEDMPRILNMIRAYQKTGTDG